MFYLDCNHLYFHLDIIQHDIIIYINIGNPQVIIMLAISIIYASIVEPDTFQLKYVTIDL